MNMAQLPAVSTSLNSFANCAQHIRRKRKPSDESIIWITKWNWWNQRYEIEWIYMDVCMQFFIGLHGIRKVLHERHTICGWNADYVFDLIRLKMNLHKLILMKLMYSGEVHNIPEQFTQVIWIYFQYRTNILGTLHFVSTLYVNIDRKTPFSNKLIAFRVFFLNVVIGRGKWYKICKLKLVWCLVWYTHNRSKNQFAHAFAAFCLFFSLKFVNFLPTFSDFCEAFWFGSIN